MLQIDSHQHFWYYEPLRDGWITEEMSVLKRNFLPDQVKGLLNQEGLNGCVAVQADQSEGETEFLIGLAREDKFIKGVVGWVDLMSDQLEERLTYFSQHAVVKGFRHILQAEKDRAFMLRPAFKKGITALQQAGFTYDLLVYPDQLSYVLELVRSFPGQPFVLDHLGKPDIKKGTLEKWRRNILEIGRHPNVYCKVSGMVTEADWKGWKAEDFTPCLDAVTEAFGTDRLMFGSDWPVCLLAASYSQVAELVKKYFASYGKEARSAIMGANAVRFYHLS